MVMNCQTSEMTDESVLVMGGTASRFNPRNLLPVADHQSSIIRPLTGDDRNDGGKTDAVDAIKIVAETQQSHQSPKGEDVKKNGLELQQLNRNSSNDEDASLVDMVDAIDVAVDDSAEDRDEEVKGTRSLIDALENPSSKKALQHQVAEKCATIDYSSSNQKPLQ